MADLMRQGGIALSGCPWTIVLKFRLHECEVTQSCATLCDPMDTRLLRPWSSLGKSTGVGCHFLLQGIFLTQGSNPGLPHCRQMLYRLSHQGSPDYSVSSPKSGLCLGTAIYDPGWDFGVSKVLISYTFKGIKCHI